MKIKNFIINHWISFFYNRLFVLFTFIKAKLWFDINYNSKKKYKSDIEVDIVIPIIERDLEILWYTINSIKKNLMHDINKIYIVAPNSNAIKKFCNQNNCNYIDENTVLPIKKKDIEYCVNWKDRSWWIYQQLLKYWMKDIVEKENFLITESEAIFLQPRIFNYKWKTILPIASAIPHLPYFNTIEKLTWIKFKPIFNFTSHHSLFSKKIINELIELIESKNNCRWFEAIIHILDKNENSCISDYETYWQFMYEKYKHDIILEHWFNIDIQRKYLNNYNNITKKLQKEYKVLSFSWYLN